MDKELNKKLFETAISEIEREKNAPTIEQIKKQIKSAAALTSKTKEVERKLSELQAKVKEKEEILTELRDGNIARIDILGDFVENPVKKSFLGEIKKYVEVLLYPEYWFQWFDIGTYNSKWDKELNNLLDNYDFTDPEQKYNIVKLNNTEIYTDFSMCKVGEMYKRAGFVTLIRARKKLKKDLPNYNYNS